MATNGTNDSRAPAAAEESTRCNVAHDGRGKTATARSGRTDEPHDA